ncbi:MAG: SPOR domain-containing protein [Gammaproteobacteria bacterium]|nr:SPOR domain-containing protein [Gammaproteobacteria bacterium]
MKSSGVVLVLLALVQACTLMPAKGEQLRARQMENAVLPMAATALDSGQLETARRLYRRLLDVDPASVSARMGLGRVALREQEPAAAARWFLSAVNHAEEPAHRHDALLAHARAALAAGQVEAAGHSFGRLIDAEDKPPRATEAWGHNGVGLTRLLSGDPHGAVASLERAVLLAPEEGRFQGNLERALALQAGFPIPDRPGEEAGPDTGSASVPPAQAPVASPAAPARRPHATEAPEPPRSPRPSTVASTESSRASDPLAAETTDPSPAPDSPALATNGPTPGSGPSAVATTASPPAPGEPNDSDRMETEATDRHGETRMQPAPNRSPSLDTGRATPRSNGSRVPEPATKREPFEAQDENVSSVAGSRLREAGAEAKPEPESSRARNAQADADIRASLNAEADPGSTGSPDSNADPDADGSAVGPVAAMDNSVLVVTEIGGQYLQFGAYAKRDRAEAVAARLRPLTGHPITLSETSDSNGRTLHRVRIGPVPADGALSEAISALESQGYRIANPPLPAAAADDSAAKPAERWRPWAVTVDGERYLQMGAFGERVKAESLATELRGRTDRAVRVSEVVRENGSALHRVRIGPLAPDDSVNELLEFLQ